MTQTQQTNKLPDFAKMSREEEATFWDTHDIADYWDEFEPGDVRFELEKTKQDTIMFRVQEGIKKQLEKIAQSKGLSVSALTRMWIIERLQNTS